MCAFYVYFFSILVLKIPQEWLLIFQIEVRCLETFVSILGQDFPIDQVWTESKLKLELHIILSELFLVLYTLSITLVSSCEQPYAEKKNYKLIVFTEVAFKFAKSQHTWSDGTSCQNFCTLIAIVEAPKNCTSGFLSGITSSHEKLQANGESCAVVNQLWVSCDAPWW